MGSWISLPEAHSVLTSKGWRMIRSRRSALTYGKSAQEISLQVRMQDGVHISAQDFLKAVDGVQLMGRQGTDMVSLAIQSTNGGSTALMDPPKSETFSGSFTEKSRPSTPEPAYVIAVKKGNCDQELIDRFFRALARYEKAVGGSNTQHIPLTSIPGGQR